jgi:hypothetical protein
MRKLGSQLLTASIIFSACFASSDVYAANVFDAVTDLFTKSSSLGKLENGSAALTKFNKAADEVIAGMGITDKAQQAKVRGLLKNMQTGDQLSSLNRIKAVGKGDQANAFLTKLIKDVAGGKDPLAAYADVSRYNESLLAASQARAMQVGLPGGAPVVNAAGDSHAAGEITEAQAAASRANFEDLAAARAATDVAAAGTREEAAAKLSSMADELGTDAKAHYASITAANRTDWTADALSGLSDTMKGADDLIKNKVEMEAALRAAIAKAGAGTEEGKRLQKILERLGKPGANADEGVRKFAADMHLERLGVPADKRLSMLDCFK